MAWQELKEETTETLFEYIQCKDDAAFEGIAKDAFRTFVFRFQLDLQKKIIPICRNWGYDDSVASELAEKTFSRVWKYPNYDKSISKQKDYDTGIKFYLYGIAKNLLADYKKNEDGLTSPFTGEEEIIYDFPDVDKIKGPVERKAKMKEMFSLLNGALNRLSPKHKIIYLTYKQYENETKEGYKLPRNLLMKLRTELDLTQTSIRVYKKEAFDIVNTFLEIYASR